MITEIILLASIVSATAVMVLVCPHLPSVSRKYNSILVKYIRTDKKLWADMLSEPRGYSEFFDKVNTLDQSVILDLCKLFKVIIRLQLIIFIFFTMIMITLVGFILNEVQIEREVVIGSVVACLLVIQLAACIFSYLRHRDTVKAIDNHIFMRRKMVCDEASSNILRRNVYDRLRNIFHHFSKSELFQVQVLNTMYYTSIVVFIIIIAFLYTKS